MILQLCLSIAIPMSSLASDSSRLASPLSNDIGSFSKPLGREAIGVHVPLGGKPRDPNASLGGFKLVHPTSDKPRQGVFPFHSSSQ